MNRLITNVVELAYHECIDLVAHISAPIFNSIHIMIFCFLAGPPLEPSSIAQPLILLGFKIPFQSSLVQIYSPVNLVASLFFLSADYGFRNLQIHIISWI